MHRRRFLSVLSAVAAAPAASQGATTAPRTSMGIATTSFMTGLRPKDPAAFLDYAHSLGAGGIQADLSPLDASALRQLRAKAEQWSMFIEVMAPLPRDEAAAPAFEQRVVAAQAAGALCIRCACLGGRRYETFSSLEAWKRFVSESEAAMDRALRIAESKRLPLAIENHKDWTVDEFVDILRRRSSEYFGVCLDTGNNISLLDDAVEVVERLAPYALSTHIKDMAVEEYPEGFLLSEVPLGQGILDIPSMVQTIRNARPKVKFTLEMITRDPLKIPCLTDKYWETFPQRNGKYLARTLAMVRKLAQPPLPRTSHLQREALLREEEENVRRCLRFAADKLQLVS
jgi:3-oxoisoapionate decarboxylase